MSKDKYIKDGKPKIDNKLSSKLHSSANFPRWLILSFVLFCGSLASIIYYFLRGSRSKKVPEDTYAEGSVDPDQEGRNKITSDHLIDTQTEKVKSLEQIRKPRRHWLGFLDSWSVPNRITDGINKVRFKPAGLFLALICAYFAQAIFDSTNSAGLFKNWNWLNNLSITTRLWLGAGIYLGAVLLWIFSLPSILSIISALKQTDPAIFLKTRYPPMRFFFIVISICASVFSILLFAQSGENAFIRGLWGIGLVFFIFSQIPFPGTHSHTDPRSEESPTFHWQNWLLLAIILAVAFFLRFYLLGTIPSDLHGDMSSYGLIARNFLSSSEKNLFGYTGWYDVQTMAVIPTILSMAVFGNNIFGLQMTAVIGGLLSLVGIYLLIWRLFNNHWLAVLTTCLVAINIAHIHFSRLVTYMDPWAFGYFALFFFVDGLKARRTSSFAWAGIFLGFCLEMYTSGWAVLFIIGFFLMYAYFFQRPWITQNKAGFVLMIIGSVITLGPALFLDLSHWGETISRSQEVFVFSAGSLAHLLNKYNTSSPFVVLLTQIKLTLLMFNQSGDSSSQFGFPDPMFSSLISPLILLGFGTAWRRWKDTGMIFLLIWLGVIAGLGGVLTVDAPFWPRLVGIVPAAAALIALAFDQITQFGKKFLGAYAVVSINILIALLLAYVSYLNWNQYYSFVKDNASVTTVTGRYIGSLPKGVTACSILSGPSLSVRETAFLAWPHTLIDIPPDAPDTGLNACTGSSVVWVLSPENIGRLPEIRSRWPDGFIRSYEFPNSDYSLTFYLVGMNETPTVEAALFGEHSRPTNIVIERIQVAVLVIWILILIIFLRIITKKTGLRRQKDVSQVTPMPKFAHVIHLPTFITSRLFAIKSWWVESSRPVYKWYDELFKIRISALSPRAIGLVLLSLMAVGLAYFAQTFLDQQISDGIHLSIKWLTISSEGERLAIACIIFLISALIWTFTTTGKKID